MTWNYLATYNDGTDGEKEYGIIEVYLDKHGAIYGWTNFIEPMGDTIEGLRWTLTKMIEDLDRYEPLKMSDIKTGMLLKERRREPTGIDNEGASS